MRMIKPGLRLKSAVCSTEIMVLRSPAAEAVLCCGGAEMIAAADAGARLDPAHAQGSLIGKRYVDEADALEILCTRGGEGSLTFNGIPLSVKQAKALPSSD